MTRYHQLVLTLIWAITIVISFACGWRLALEDNELIKMQLREAATDLAQRERVYWANVDPGEPKSVFITRDEFEVIVADEEGATGFNVPVGSQVHLPMMVNDDRLRSKFDVGFSFPSGMKLAAPEGSIFVLPNYACDEFTPSEQGTFGP